MIFTAFFQKVRIFKHTCILGLKFLFKTRFQMTAKSMLMPLQGLRFGARAPLAPSLNCYATDAKGPFVKDEVNNVISSGRVSDSESSNGIGV